MSKLLAASVETLDRTVDAIRTAGEGAKEAAAFWLGRIDALEVDVIVVPAGPEVEWSGFSVRISERWMLRLAEMCDRLDRIVLGAVHSHPGAAFFSTIDSDAFFHAPDCVSVVLPSYANTTSGEAKTSWGLYVGLPDNHWRAGRWDDDVVTGRLVAEVLELR